MPPGWGRVAEGDIPPRGDGAGQSRGARVGRAGEVVASALQTELSQWRRSRTLEAAARALEGAPTPHLRTSRGIARTAVAAAPVEVWSYDAATGRDTLVQRTGGAASTDAVARQAYENAVRVMEYYKRVHGRNSYDNRGTVLKLRVHAPDAGTGQTPANNAYWFNDEGRIWLGDGDGRAYSPFGNAVDVVAHEFTHGVVDAEVRLDTWGQEGGLHESFSDVMATGLDGNWQIGEGIKTPGVPGDAIRDLQNPKWNNAKSLPPGENEPHALANIPNHAAYKVATKVGADNMRKIWYSALTDHLRGNSGFAGARQATLAAAKALYGEKSSEWAAVRDAWEAVGVDERTAKEFFYSAEHGFSMSVEAVQQLKVKLG